MFQINCDRNYLEIRRRGYLPSTSLLAAKIPLSMLTFLILDLAHSNEKNKFSYLIIVRSHKMLWHWKDDVALETLTDKLYMSKTTQCLL